MARLVRALRLLDRALAAVEVALLSVCLLGLVLLVSAEGASRNAGVLAGKLTPALLHVKAALHWDHGPRVAQHLVLWVAMFGAALAARDRRHISIEAVSKLVSPQGKRVIEGIVDLGTVAVCALLAYVAWGFVEIERAIELEKVARGQEREVLLAIGGTAVPPWWSLCVLPVGLGLVGWHYAGLALARIFVDEPVDVAKETAEEIEHYEKAHGSGEREAAS